MSKNTEYQLSKKSYIGDTKTQRSTKVNVQ